ncbi:hypothetical protein CJ030_MR8G000767 [Morella rubra]|uniref:F-box domain-containing protein n=1 Tax=Morella rubra TaxID=262757 RepID=A0A6A1UUZ3_9ROSI|nr:hypothetical protein CJ030_MR8G000767 [Morella rubra]
MDGFDRVPDALIVIIFNSVSDVKTLIRCRAVCKRFNSLVPNTEYLILKLDCVIASETGIDNSAVLTLVRSVFKLLNGFFSLNAPQIRTRSVLNSPGRILRGFESIRDLHIMLPSGDLKLEKNAVVKWKANFGRTLRSCVIFGFREIRASPPTEVPADFFDMQLSGGLKQRVGWTISALVAASARHSLLREVVGKNEELERVVMEDKEGEGTMVFDKEDLKEFREVVRVQYGKRFEGLAAVAALAAHFGLVNNATENRNSLEDRLRRRTKVPNVRIKMRHVPKLDLKGGEWVDSPTLVVVRAASSSASEYGEAEVEQDAERWLMEAVSGLRVS